MPAAVGASHRHVECFNLRFITEIKSSMILILYLGSFIIGFANTADSDGLIFSFDPSGNMHGYYLKRRGP